jgi:autonomous glycyl radical cofactor GrcA
VENIDEFARSLLEESKRFLEKAKEEDEPAKSAYLHAALAFSSLEAHINAITEDFVSRKELTTHEVALMQQREVRLENGQFVIQNVLKMVRLEDRIDFLHTRFSGTVIDHQSVAWWSQMLEATKLRNKLTHPKEQVKIDLISVSRAIQAIIDTVDALYMAIYKSGFPAAGMQLDSKLDF